MRPSTQTGHGSIQTRGPASDQSRPFWNPREPNPADLAALAPSAEEAAAVLDWLFREELVVAGAVTELRNLLKNLGHEELVCRYPELGV